MIPRLCIMFISVVGSLTALPIVHDAEYELELSSLGTKPLESVKYAETVCLHYDSKGQSREASIKNSVPSLLTIKFRKDKGSGMSRKFKILSWKDHPDKTHEDKFESINKTGKNTEAESSERIIDKYNANEFNDTDGNSGSIKSDNRSQHTADPSRIEFIDRTREKALETGVNAANINKDNETSENFDSFVATNTQRNYIYSTQNSFSNELEIPTIKMNEINDSQQLEADGYSTTDVASESMRSGYQEDKNRKIFINNDSFSTEQGTGTTATITTSNDYRGDRGFSEITSFSDITTAKNIYNNDGAVRTTKSEYEDESSERRTFSSHFTNNYYAHLSTFNSLLKDVTEANSFFSPIETSSPSFQVTPTILEQTADGNTDPQTLVSNEEKIYSSNILEGGKYTTGKMEISTSRTKFEDRNEVTEHTSYFKNINVHDDRTETAETVDTNDEATVRYSESTPRRSDDAHHLQTTMGLSISEDVTNYAVTDRPEEKFIFKETIYPTITTLNDYTSTTEDLRSKGKMYGVVIDMGKMTTTSDSDSSGTESGSNRRIDSNTDRETTDSSETPIDTTVNVYEFPLDEFANKEKIRDKVMDSKNLTTHSAEPSVNAEDEETHRRIEFSIEHEGTGTPEIQVITTFEPAVSTSRAIIGFDRKIDVSSSDLALTDRDQKLITTTSSYEGFTRRDQQDSKSSPSSVSASDWDPNISHHYPTMDDYLPTTDLPVKQESDGISAPGRVLTTDDIHSHNELSTTPLYRHDKKEQSVSMDPDDIEFDKTSPTHEESSTLKRGTDESSTTRHLEQGSTTEVINAESETKFEIPTQRGGKTFDLPERTTQYSSTESRTESTVSSVEMTKTHDGSTFHGIQNVKNQSEETNTAYLDDGNIASTDIGNKGLTTQKTLYESNEVTTSYSIIPNRGSTELSAVDKVTIPTTDRSGINKDVPITTDNKILDHSQLHLSDSVTEGALFEDSSSEPNRIEDQQLSSTILPSSHDSPPPYSPLSSPHPTYKASTTFFPWNSFNNFTFRLPTQKFHSFILPDRNSFYYKNRKRKTSENELYYT